MILQKGTNFLEELTDSRARTGKVQVETENSFFVCVSEAKKVYSKNDGDMSKEHRPSLQGLH